VAKYVQQARDEGDTVATSILKVRPTSSSRRRRAGMARLELTGTSFTFVLSGGMFQAVPCSVNSCSFSSRLSPAGCTVMRLDVPPALGAVRLALAELRGDARLPVYRPNLT
jgi:N-acetylglucosamine kinase-like BadF-type ATPase